MIKTQISITEITQVLKYLPKIDSIINLLLSGKKWKNIFEMINENTFSLTEKTIQFFPNIHTLHLFTENDQKLVTHSIQHYIYWYSLSYKQYKSENNNFKRNELFNSKTVQFKSIIYKKEDREEFFNSKNKIPKKCQEIGENCFGEVEKLEKIEIPNSIVRLGNNCFYWCYGLENVIIPNSITSIGNNCFECCESLENIQFSTSIKIIGNKCFRHCWMLSNIQLPNSIVSIGNKCFSNCKNLREIELSDNLTSIGFDCFEKCGKLSKISASKDWKNEGNKLFNTKQHLCSFEIPTNVSYLNTRRIKVVDLIVYRIPTNVTSLGNYCFSRCYKLKKLIIPSSVKEIGDYCFNDCKMLKELIFNSPIHSFGINCFYKSGIEENCFINTSKNSIKLSNSLHSTQITSTPISKNSNKLNKSTNSNDINISNNPNKFIKEIIQQNIRESAEISQDQLFTIEQWSGKIVDNIVFDSNVDNYEMNISQFDKILLNKSQLLIIIKTEKEDYFGCYINGKIDKIRNWISSSDGFVFTLRNEMKMKFDIKESEKDHFLYIYPSKCYNQLMKIGYHDIVISKDNSLSSLYQNDQSSFDYQNISEAILGKTGRECFSTKRIIVYQMK